VRRRHTITLGLLGLYLAPGAAGAQETWTEARQRHLEPTLYGILGPAPTCPGSFYGVGLRAALPLLRRGLLNWDGDTVGVFAGAEVVRYVDVRCRSTAVTIPVGAQWNFYLDRAWSLLVEPLVWLAVPVDTNSCATDACRGLTLLPGLAVGIRWHFRGDEGYPAVIVRGGWPTGFSIGLSL
jgi:hypothetical protein